MYSPAIRSCRFALESPTTLNPSLLTNLTSFLICFAKHNEFVHVRTSAPLSDVIISVSAPHTGQCTGMLNHEPLESALTHFGMILLAFIIESFVPLSPIPNLLHSLMLQSEALYTVVPSSCTGSKKATGVIALIEHGNSISQEVVYDVSS